ncbi:MAG TPA: septum formation initiator family protein [Ferruginibacter sp.]|nr:septum formation initiator family protein [Ferruginibacter sp.]
MKKFISIIKIFRNKYLLALLLFVAWMVWFDPKDWCQTYDRIQKLNNLQENEQKLTQQIAQTQTELNLLKTSAETIETYAREKYYMKKDNEDLFIVKSR